SYPGRYAGSAAVRGRSRGQYSGPRWGEIGAEQGQEPVPHVAIDLGRWWLRGEVDRLGRIAVRVGAGDCEAERHGQGLGAAAATVGGRADVRLVEPMPGVDAGLRVPRRDE